MKNRFFKRLFSFVFCLLIIGNIINLQNFKTNAAKSITFNPAKIEVLVGKYAMIGAVAGKDTITFKSKNTKIVKVNSKTGKVKGIAPGVCKVKATTSKGVSASIKVTVKIPITFNKTRVVILPGETTTVKATAGKDKITYSSSNPKIATVNKTTGKIEALSTGTCKLRATSSSGVTKAIWLNVRDSLNTSNIKYIAHRGARDLAPECTIPAFKQAKSSGYQAFEGDIWQTSYNNFIVFHETLAQKLGKNVDIKKITKEQVKKYPIVYGTNIEKYSPLYIPSVAKVLKYAKTTNMEVYFHLKVNSSSLPFTKESAKKLSSIIKNSGIENRVVIFSSNKKALKLLQPYKLRMGYLNMAKTATDMKTVAKYAKDNGCGTVFLKYYPNLMLPKSVVEYCHDLNLQVGSFSLNNTTEVENLINVGADFAVCNKVMFKK